MLDKALCSGNCSDWQDLLVSTLLVQNRQLLSLPIQPKKEAKSAEGVQPTENKQLGIGKRAPQPRIDKFFLYMKNGSKSLKDLKDSDDSDFVDKSSNRRSKKARAKSKAKSKATAKAVAERAHPLSQEDGEVERRKVPKGVSVFDLIMPWKQDI